MREIQLLDATPSWSLPYLQNIQIFPKLDLPYCVHIFFSGQSVFFLQDIFCKTFSARAETQSLSFFLKCPLSLCYPSPSSCLIFSLFPSISQPYFQSLSWSHLFWHSNIAELNFLRREVEYSRPVSPGEPLERRRLVRSVVGLFHTDPTDPTYVVEAHREGGKHTLRSRPRVCSHVRQPWIKRSIHRVDWSARKYNSVCSILQWQWNTGSWMQQREKQREREWQIDRVDYMWPLLELPNFSVIGQRLSVLQNAMMSFQFEEHQRGEQIKAFPVGQVWCLSWARRLIAQSDT